MKKLIRTLLFATIMPVTLNVQAQTQEKNMSKQNVSLETNKGVITIELDLEKAPKTSQNFIDYVKAGHYDGVIFHRVIKGFMIQGGGFAPGMSEKPTREPIQNEADNGLKNDKYTVAMARTNDPHSASAQFFINTADNDFLNFKSKNAQGWGYAVSVKLLAVQK